MDEISFLHLLLVVTSVLCESEVLRDNEIELPRNVSNECLVNVLRDGDPLDYLCIKMNGQLK